MRSSIPEHEKIFDEICGKLNELSHRVDQGTDEPWSEKIEKMQGQLRRSQDELRNAQEELHDRLNSFDQFSSQQSDLGLEISRVTEQLEAERMTNSKLSTDLAKSLELNLKLQFEIEEIRSKSSQILMEERKHNSYLIEKNKSLTSELELSQAVQTEAKVELAKAKDKIQKQQEQWIKEKEEIQAALSTYENLCKDQSSRLDQFADMIRKKDSELQQLTDSLTEFEGHSAKQSEALKNLSSVAEKKMVELKVTLDKKTTECQDYYSHLQQALTQVSVLRQENAALKDYISKVTALHQQAQSALRSNTEPRAALPS